MWTSTRTNEMSAEHFVPNHFVPLVPTKYVEEQVSSSAGVGVFGSLIGKHVIVRYDGSFYPGIVIDEDTDDVKVRCMSRAGNNRFYWPPREDICYYMREDVGQLIPEPEHVTGRHLRVDPTIWQSLQII